MRPENVNHPPFRFGSVDVFALSSMSTAFFDCFDRRELYHISIFRCGVMRDIICAMNEWTMTNDPLLQLAAIVAVVAAGVMVILWVITRRARNPGECTDFTHAFDRPPGEGRAPSRPRVPAPPLEPEVDELPPLEPEMDESPSVVGVILVPDASVSEVSELAPVLESANVRFAVRQTVLDNSFHQYGNGGMGTRMCIIVHPDDAARAQPIINSAIYPQDLAPSTEETFS